MLVHCLVYLLTEWSIKCKALFRFYKLKDLNIATHCLVTPKPKFNSTRTYLESKQEVEGARQVSSKTYKVNAKPEIIQIENLEKGIGGKAIVF